MITEGANMNIEWVHALWGGILIGISVSLMLFWNGRVTGISGIIYGLFNPVKSDMAWRFSFVLGLIFGGLTLKSMNLFNVENMSVSSLQMSLLAGLLVGFGTVLGSGCTSGHGVCGISRLSPRSIVATLTFIFSGIIAVYFFRKLGIYL